MTPQQRFRVSYHSELCEFTIEDRERGRVVAVFDAGDTLAELRYAENLCRFCYSALVGAVTEGEL